MSTKKAVGTGKKRVGAKKPQKFQSTRTNDIIEDLDLDVDSYFPEQTLPTAFDGKEEERVVMNQKAKRRGGARKTAADDDEDDNVHAVLPNDAHRGVHADEDEDVAVEEAALALAKNKKARKGLSEDDFALEGVAPTSSKKANAPNKASKSEAVLETIQRDLSALSTADRRALIEKESPEVIKLLDEYKTYLAEVTKISKPLHELIHSKKVTSVEERNLLAFLETKAQLLLSYCMHVSFYLLLKAEGKSVANHPVIDRLVELRVYIEKLWPLEQKLQYSLNKLISQGPSAKGATAAAVNLRDLRPVSTEEGALYKPSGAKLGDDAAKQRRLARRQMQEEEELRQAEEDAMIRVQRKKGKSVDASFLEHAAEDGYREDDDQFFSRMVADEDSGSDNEDANMSLIEKLRAKASGKTKPTSNSKRSREEDELEDEDYEEGDEDFDDEEFEDDDLLDEMNEEGEEDDEAYAQLVSENRAIKKRRDEEKAERDAENERFGKKSMKGDRRKISKNITNHRGLTKVRPKDRKTPHLAQRHKYDKGLAKARNMTKSYKPEPSSGFSGVSGFRANVTHGTKL